MLHTDVPQSSLPQKHSLRDHRLVRCVASYAAQKVGGNLFEWYSRRLKRKHHQGELKSLVSLDDALDLYKRCTTNLRYKEHYYNALREELMLQRKYAVFEKPFLASHLLERRGE